MTLASDVIAFDGIPPVNAQAVPVRLVGGGAGITPGSNESASANGALINRSGTITAGDTAQVIMAANALRRYLLIQNIDLAEDLWFNFTATAVKNQPSVKLPPGASFVMEGTFVSTEAISVIAATTAHAFVAKEG